MTRLRTLAWFALALVALGACHNNDEPVTPPSVVTTPSKYFYTLVIQNARPIDTATAQYVLWFLSRGDSVFRSPTSLPFWVQNGNSIVFSGSLLLKPDSISIVLVSLEPKVIPATPSSQLISGWFYSSSVPAASLVPDDAIGNYGKVGGSALFTTTSTDTNRARSEFYLMQFVGGTPVSSLTNLPPPPKGWTYGLWVLDSNFYPMHKFFYGAFTSPVGHDTDPTTDAYPYPGGFKPPLLTDPGGRLEVTLEPTFELQNGELSVPSPFVVLYTQLQRFINFNQSLPLTNVWEASAPSGTLTISKQ